MHYCRLLGDTIEGTVFTHDSTAGVVVIEAKGAGGKSTYRMLRSSAVQELVVLAPTAPEPLPSADASWAARVGANGGELPAIDLAAVNARYCRAILKVRGRRRTSAPRPAPHPTPCHAHTNLYTAG